MTGRGLLARVRLRHRGPGSDFSLDAALEAPPGITMVLGPSGSGKSTLLSVLAGLTQPDEGRIAVGDQVWFDSSRGVSCPPHLRQVAMVFQSAALFPHMTALGNVEFALGPSVPRRERQERAAALLAQMKVGHRAHQFPARLSGGETQRVALARAIARSPRLVLLDEPFSALDRELSLSLAREVCERLLALHVPVLFVTHDPEEALMYAERVWMVEHGAVRSCAHDEVPDASRGSPASGRVPLVGAVERSG
ncbi:hypothetical protein BE08_06065 [Sorangium cellulosum]|uniref:ABC transporter domain-containing protein n=1 Tax=Sorangium cellulosum TaxID=56 RepID=A0A150P2M9_SORCE|nr:hypothetical protein BE08_06065 [Sorangium cellulosum]